MSGECIADKDFLRHIVNKVISNSIEKLPLNVVDDIRKNIARGESKFGFSTFGGDPKKLIDYFNSEEWRDLVDFANNLHITWLLEEILKTLIEEYKDNCSPVAETAREIIEKQLKSEIREEEKLTIENIYRTLRYAGFKVEITSDGIVVEEPFIKVRLDVKNGKINYSICKEGRVSTLDAILAKIEKIREL